jgi:LPS export ABC transporter protein LptC
MKLISHSLKSVMIVFTILTLFACEGNYREKQQLTIADLGPIAEGVGVNLKYTDSGKLVANLITPKLLDFSNYNFSFAEFPEGLEVQFWNEKGEKGTVTSDYGIQFDEANLVDLRGNVVLITADSLTLNTTQLYWDQNNKWIFTDQPYRITFKDGSFNDGGGFDSSEDFNTFLSRKNIGVQIVDNIEKPKEDEQ